jgi:glycine/D-amino acid oxidase-like deaminating enzyme
VYEVTPDHNALIGEAPRPARLLYATGFSGHGFLQGPAVGEVVRDLFLGRRPPVDVSPLAVDRFHRGRDRHERNIV